MDDVKDEETQPDEDKMKGGSSVERGEEVRCGKGPNRASSMSLSKVCGRKVEDVKEETQPDEDKTEGGSSVERELCSDEERGRVVE